MPSKKLAIEVEGEIHDEGKPNFQKRQDAKQRKLVLLKHMGIALLMLRYTDFDDVPAVITRIRQAL
ncbi:MAG: hypothetical protein U0Y68_23955 [Blastocatellia bacterium]